MSLAALFRESLSMLRDIEKAIASPIFKLDELQVRYDNLHLPGGELHEAELLSTQLEAAKKENQELRERLAALEDRNERVANVADHGTVSLAGSLVVCKECKAAGQTSTVTEVPGSGYVTAMYCAPFYDERGQYHHHDMNLTRTGYNCSQGHSWIASTRKGCPSCNWPMETIP